MENYSHFVFARALHIAAVVFWIGGVAFVTTVLIPALKKISDTNDRLELFEKLEGKFGFQAKITTLITGLSDISRRFLLTLLILFSSFSSSSREV